MNKHFITIFGLLAIAFLVVTVIKYITGNESHPPASITLEKERANRDSSVVEFWKYYNKATDLRSRGQYTEAINFYSMALDMDSTHNNALYYLGNMQLAARKFAEAEESWKKLTEIHKRSARGHLQLGNLYSCKTEDNLLFEIKRAREHFKTAARLNAEETGPLLQLSKIRILDEDYDEAENMLHDVISSNFRSTEAYFLAGYLNWHEGENTVAGQHLQRAVAIHSESGKESSNVGEGETKAGGSPMLAKTFRCSLFSDYITGQLQNITGKNNSVDSTYGLFKKELGKYK